MTTIKNVRHIAFFYVFAILVKIFTENQIVTIFWGYFIEL